MQAVVREKFNQDRCVWAFRCRNNDVRFTQEMVDEISDQIDHFCTLTFTDEERGWLAKKFPWLGQSYIDFLYYWHPHRDQITINAEHHKKYNDCGLTIEADGSWIDTMMYEIPILAIVNEVYFAFKYGEGKLDEYVMNVTQAKIDRLRKGEINIGTFSEFGMRRRYSAATQDLIVAGLKYSKIPGFVGTSNVYLAKKYGVTAVGTQAHEFFMCQQGHHEINPAYSNRFALQAWNDYYKTKLGIALTDTIGTDVFLRDFDENFSTLFSGVRHDSGDPFKWGDKMIAHYKKFGIDPKTKTLLFSDSLNLAKAAMLYDYFKYKAKVAFGIGTYWTAPFDPESMAMYNGLNDIEIHPLNIVMKPIEFNGAPVCKLSNDAGKAMSQDKEYIDYLRRTIDWRLAHEKEA
jgi:nicotinate phosphoribosyltransferase